MIHRASPALRSSDRSFRLDAVLKRKHPCRASVKMQGTDAFWELPKSLAFEQCVYECFRIKWSQIIRAFAQTN